MENESRKDAIRVSTLKNDPCASRPRVDQSLFLLCYNNVDSSAVVLLFIQIKSGSCHALVCTC